MRPQTFTIKILMTTTVVLFSLGVVNAQSISIQSDNIAWSVNSMNDMNANVTVAYQCKIITFANQNIDWVQDNGNYVNHFSISNTQGQWTNPSENGSITYTISGEGLTGQLTISNSSSGLSASLQLSGATDPINHTYSIQSYERM